MNKKLSNIPGMKQFALNVSHAETISNRICMQVCDWIKKHGKIPFKVCKDATEQKLGKWLHNQRRAKAGKGTYIFYPSNLFIAKKHGLPNLFEKIDREKASNEICHECCKWILKHGKTPSSYSEDPIEKKLGKWLVTQRRAKLSEGTNIFYPSNLAIAKKYGLPILFEQINLEKASNEICHECCKWTVKHGKTPSHGSKDPIEKKLGAWLYHQRQAKVDKSSWTWYPSNLAIAKKHDLPKIFEQINLEKASNEICHECCKWILKHGKTPSTVSKDPIEKKLALWLRTQRLAKRGKGDCTFYPSNLAIAKKHDLPDLFEQIGQEKHSNAICHECCKWIVKHGKTPSTVSKDPIEKKLALWLRSQRLAKRGKGTYIFYPSNLAVAKKYDLHKIFERMKITT